MLLGNDLVREKLGQKINNYLQKKMSNSKTLHKKAKKVKKTKEK